MAIKYRPDIDGLRALAVVAVVLYHLGISTVPGGFVGVDIFFVISGYLISAILIRDIAKGEYRTAIFYERRIRRIIPAFCVMTVVAAVAGSILMLPDDLAALGGSIAASAAFLSNLYFWTTSGDYFAGPAELQPLLHTWSLSVEEQFYIFFPIFLWLVHRAKLWRFTFPIILLIAFISFVTSIYGTQNNPVATFYWLPTRAWELLGGALLALSAGNSSKYRLLAEFQSVASLCLLLYPIFCYSASTSFPGLNALPPVLGAMLFIHAGSGNYKPLLNRLASSTPFRGIGLISYSLYLWHWPVIVFLKYYFIELSLHLTVIAGLLSLVLAALSWRFVEQPFRRSRPNFSPKLYFVFAGVPLAFLLVAGALMLTSFGFPSRVPPAIVKMAEKTTYQGPWRECGGVYAMRRTADTVCQLGDVKEKPTFLLTGDSHANALAAALFQSAESVNRSGIQITDTGYRPSLGYEKFGEQSKYKYLNRLLVEYIDANPSITSIVVAIYWRQAISVDTYINANGERLGGSLAIENGLKALFERYPEKNFLLVDSPANSKLFGGAVAARAKWYGWEFEPHVGVREFDTVQAAYEPIVTRLTQIHNVKLLRLSTKLCDRNICQGFLNGEPAYADDNHLAYAASKLFIPEFLEFLSEDPLRSQNAAAKFGCSVSDSDC